jgi:tape measure domain-containing protein
MSIAKIQAVLDLDTGQFHGGINSAIGGVKKFNTSIRSADKHLADIRKSVSGFGASIRNTMVTLGQFRGAMHTVWAMTGQWVGSIITASAKLERLNALMSGMAKGANSIERAKNAMEDMNYVLGKARNAPFSIDEIGNAFVKLKSAGIDPTAGALDALSNAVAAFGGDDQTFHRATVAIQQMAGKGVISMEEMRQQLGEAVPSAMTLLARAANMTMSDLVKQISLGRVASGDALNRLLIEMQLEFAGKAEAMMGTWNGLVSRLKTEWLVFAQEVGKEGLFGGAKEALLDLINFMGSADGKSFAADLGKGLAFVTRNLANMITLFVQNRDEIAKWASVLATAFAVVKLNQFSSMIVTVFGNMKNSYMALARVTTASTVATGINTAATNANSGAKGKNTAATLAQKGAQLLANSQIATATTTVTTATNATRLGTAATRGFSIAISAMGGPIGVAITAIGLLIGAFMKTKMEANSAARAIDDFNKKAREGIAVSEEDNIAAKSRIANGKAFVALVEKLEKNGRLSSAERVSLDSLGRGFGQTMPDVPKNLDDIKAKIDGKVMPSLLKAKESVQKTLKEMESNIGGSIERTMQSAVESTVSNYSTRLDSDMNQVSARLNGRLAEIYKEFGTKQGPERAKAISDAFTAPIEQAVGDVAAATTRLNAAKYRLNQANQSKDKDLALKSKQEILTWEGKIDALIKHQEKIRDMKNQLLGNIDKPLDMMTPKGGEGEKKANKQADALANYYATITGKIAELEAQIDGGIPKLARFRELLALGAKGPYGANPNAGMVAEIEGALTKMDDLKKQADNLRIVDEIFTNLEAMQASAGADLLVAGMEDANPVFESLAGNSAKFTRQIAIQRVELEKAGNDMVEYDKKVAQLNATLAKIDLSNIQKTADNMIFEEELARLPNHEKNLKLFNRQLAYYKDLRDKLLAADPENAGKIEKTINDLISAETAKFNRVQQGPVRDFVDKWIDVSDEMNTVWDNAMDGIANTLTELVTTGKASFRDLATSILKEITRILISKALAQLVDIFMSFMPSFGGGSSGSGGGQTADIITFANGGIMSKYGQLPLHKYANGGVANSPQMALFGEGRGPEAYVPLPDGRTIPVTMEGGGSGGNQNNITIAITMNGDGSSSSSIKEDDKNGAKQLAGLIKTQVVQTLNQESKPGGILWRQKNG